jgi:hypothetical protein
MPLVMPIGVGGAPARVLHADPVAAWVETVRDRAVTPTIDRVKAHDAVTETALLTGATPLPARFGQTFESDDACVAALRSQEPRLLADLERVRDLVEMRIVIALVLPVDDPAAGTDASPGLAYMQRLMQSRDREQAAHALAGSLREEMHGVVGPYVRREAYAVNVSPAILTLSHLVARDDVSSYRAALTGATLATPVARLAVSGPGAPYQFVSPPA